MAAARAKLLKAFKPKIIAAAKGHPAATPSCLKDLTSAASIGFLIALDRFDRSKGCKLQTYASYWIRAEVNQAAADINPSYKQRRWLKRKQKESDVEYEKRTGLARAMLNAVDIDAPLHEGNPDSERVGSLIPDENVQDPCALGSARELIEAALNELDARERRILEARHLRDTPITLDRLAGELGISGERVRQLEILAVEKLTAHIRRANYAEGAAE
jgi:RNA polymerase sigma-32 factor